MRITNYVFVGGLLILLIAVMACTPTPPADQTDLQDSDQDDSGSEVNDVTDESQTPVPSDGTTTDGDDDGDESEADMEDSDEDEAAEDEEADGDDSGTVIIHLPDGSTVSHDYEKDMELTSNEDLPEDWPNDVPIMPGFELVGEVFVMMDQKIFTLSAGGEVPPEEVEIYYKNLPGWEFAQDVEIEGAPDGSISFVMMQGSDSLTISIGPVPPGPWNEFSDYALILVINLGE